MTEKNAIVYGGSGFLGSHVADALSNSGYQVKIFDCRQSSYLQDNQEMIIADLMDQNAVIQAAKDCQYIYNFAGLADIDDAKNRPAATVSLNVLGNVHVLEAARLAKAKRFIFASSVYVYSKSGSFYRASKQASEQFVEAYYERYGLEYTILRYGSLYGRRADKRNGIYRLLKQALETKSITYDGDGESMREYIHVEDAARLSVKILEPDYTNRHIILTGQERMPVKNLMKMIAEMLPDAININYSDKPMYGHYIMTPYAFHPKVGHKLVANDYVDLGQGLLDCLAELHEHYHQNEHAEGNWLLVDNEGKHEI